MFSNYFNVPPMLVN